MIRGIVRRSSIPILAQIPRSRNVERTGMGRNSFIPLSEVLLSQISFFAKFKLAEQLFVTY
jgi:hypothetical protein